MSIGLSHNARQLLTQIVEVHQRGQRQGRGDEELTFTLTVDAGRTTVTFASGDQPLETSDMNAIDILRANGFIEEFATITRTSNIRRYVVTQAAVLLTGQPAIDSGPGTNMRRRTNASTATMEPADARVSSRLVPATEAANAKRTK